MVDSYCAIYCMYCAIVIRIIDVSTVHTTILKKKVILMYVPNPLHTHIRIHTLNEAYVLSVCIETKYGGDAHKECTQGQGEVD